MLKFNTFLYVILYPKLKRELYRHWSMLIVCIISMRLGKKTHQSLNQNLKKKQNFQSLLTN